MVTDTQIIVWLLTVALSAILCFTILDVVRLQFVWRYFPLSYQELWQRIMDMKPTVLFARDHGCDVTLEESSGRDLIG